ncbi:MAG: CDP-glucose 4,6-dehydratase [Promethearchaeota archaeon]
MRELFENFFEDKNIFITGHTGFIGSWLAIWLNELGAKIVGYSLPPLTKRDNFVVSNLEKEIISFIGDIRNYDKMNNVFKKYQFDIIFHLAAQPIVRKSYLIPKETYDVNVGGTVNIFEIFRKTSSCKILINVTTDKCYENQEKESGYVEDDRLGGYDPYSSSKACSELITTAYRNSFFNKDRRASSVRVGNVIGGGDWQEDRLIPDCMRALLNNKEIVIRNPKSIRPWQYVLEPIRGFLSLTKHMWEGNNEYSGAWNFGPDKNSIFTVEEIVNKILKYIGKGNYTYLSDQKDNQFHETKTLLLDCSKSSEYLEWEPKLKIQDTIQFVCDWYMEENVSYDYDIDQIKKYIEKISK